MRRGWIYALIAIVVLYFTLTAALWAIMLQPLDRFGQIMAYMPGPMFMILPFKPLWFSARGGTLKVGDVAPDFTLSTIDKKSQVRLGDDRGRPVVLIFGSYT